LLKELLREDSRKRPEGQWETIPDQRASHRDAPVLPGRSTSKWDMEEAHVGGAYTPSTKGKTTRVNKIGRGLAYQEAPD